MDLLDALLLDAARDARRPWLRRTTGGLLVAVVLAAILSGLAVDLLGH